MNAFTENKVKYNAIRILILGTIYTGLEMFGLIASSMGLFKSDIRLYVGIIVAFHLVYLPTIFLLYKKNNIKVLRHVEHIYYYALLTWASIFNTLQYIQNKDITIYSIAIMLVAALFIIEPWLTRVMFSINFFLFSTLIFFHLDQILIVNELIFKTLIISIIAVVMSNSNYNIRKQLFNSQKGLIHVNEQLKDQAQRDSLTKLYNNGFLFEFLNKTIKGKHTPDNFSLLMLDIDNFKRINDEHGHLFGDQVLIRVAQTLEKLTRDTDVVCRYGGEEFVVLLCHANLDIAKRIAERIRQEIENQIFNEEVKVTVSIGVSGFKNQDPLELIKEADDLLYVAKNSGKNRVMA